MTLLASVLLALAAAAAPADEGAGAGDPPPPPPPPEVELSTLRAERGAWLGREVVLVLQFDEAVERWNPWLTRFSPRRWEGFEAWGDEQLLFDREAFDDPAPRLFARRGGAAALALAHARRYDRFRVRARVREVFLDEPWIEVLAAEPLRERVNEGTLTHAVRALDLIEEERFSLARNELLRASAPRNLPANVVAELERLGALCDERGR